MKKTIIRSAILMTIFSIGCNRNGNTGNGANDPTSKYEPNNIKNSKDLRLQGNNDSTATITDTSLKQNMN